MKKEPISCEKTASKIQFVSEGVLHDDTGSTREKNFEKESKKLKKRADFV